MFRYLDEGIRPRDHEILNTRPKLYIIRLKIIQFCRQGPKKQHETYFDRHPDRPQPPNPHKRTRDSSLVIVECFATVLQCKLKTLARNRRARSDIEVSSQT